MKLKNMKKLLTIAFLTSLSIGVIAQEAGEKNVLAGITLGGAMSFNNPQTNSIDAKVGGDFIVGMALDWHFSQNIGLSTGLEFDFDRLKTIYKEDEDVYFDYRDKEILQQDDYNSGNTDPSFMLAERKHKSIYLSVPIMLRFETNYMGYIRYFGKFGVRNSFLLTTRTDNEGTNMPFVDPKVGNELEDMKSPGVMSFYKGSIGLTAGAEYNITGSTVIVGEIGYFYGFSEIFQQEGSLFGDDEKDLSLYNGDKNNRKYYAPSLKQGQLMLKVSVLF
jgi:hypothetical protein